MNLPEIIWIKTSELTPLENNPRLIKDERFEKLKKGLKASPELFEMRPCLVNKRDGKLIVYAGNMRLRAAKSLKLKEVPCIVSELSIEKEREFTLRDNIELGEFDLDILANEFSDLELSDFGVEMPNFESEIPEEPQNLIGSKDVKDSTITITFETQSDLDKCLNEIKPIAEKHKGNIKVNSGLL